LIDNRHPGAVESDACLLYVDGVLWRGRNSFQPQRVLFSERIELFAVDPGQNHRSGFCTFRCFRFTGSETHVTSRGTYLVQQLETSIGLMAHDVEVSGSHDVASRGYEFLDFFECRAVRRGNWL